MIKFELFDRKVGIDDVIYTRDGGLTWENRSPIEDPTQIYCVYFLEDGVSGWIAGYDGYVARTTDGGIS